MLSEKSQWREIGGSRYQHWRSDNGATATTALTLRIRVRQSGGSIVLASFLPVHQPQPSDLIGVRLFDQGTSSLAWLRTHIKLKIRLTPSAAENCRKQNGIRHIDANRQNYALSRKVTGSVTLRISLPS
jgi:hypothetical protein